MIRSLLVGIALTVSLFSVTGFADVLPRPGTRNAEPVQCACVKAPCPCDDIMRRIRLTPAGETTLTNCSGGDFRGGKIGAKPVCTFENVFCDTYRGNPREVVRMKGIKAFCLPNRSDNRCPNAEDCVNSDDVEASDFRRVVLDPERTGDETCNDAEADNNPPPAARARTRPAARAGSNQ